MHIYERNGLLYPSVTTVLSLIDTNEELMKWANIMGFKKINIKTIQEHSLSYGTKVHANLQYYVDPDNCTEPEPDSDMVERFNIEKAITNFKKLFKDITFKTIFTEKTFYDDELHYAGTCDWFVEINGYKVLIDFKTSKAPYPNYRMQLGGYMNLIEKNTDYHVDIGAIVICNQNTSEMYPVNRNTLDANEKAFFSLLNFYHIREEINSMDYDKSLIQLFKNNPDN